MTIAAWCGHCAALHPARRGHPTARGGDCRSPRPRSSRRRARTRPCRVCHRQGAGGIARTPHGVAKQARQVWRPPCRNCPGLKKLFPGVLEVGGEFHANVEIARLAIALKNRVLILKAVDQAQREGADTPSKASRGFCAGRSNALTRWSPGSPRCCGTCLPCVSRKPTACGTSYSRRER